MQYGRWTKSGCWEESDLKTIDQQVQKEEKMQEFRASVVWIISIILAAVALFLIGSKYGVAQGVLASVVIFFFIGAPLDFAARCHLS